MRVLDIGRGWIDQLFKGALRSRRLRAATPRLTNECGWTLGKTALPSLGRGFGIHRRWRSAGSRHRLISGVPPAQEVPPHDPSARNCFMAQRFRRALIPEGTLEI